MLFFTRILLTGYILVFSYILAFVFRRDLLASVYSEKFLFFTARKVIDEISKTNSSPEFVDCSDAGCAGAERGGVLAWACEFSYPW